MTMRKKNKNNPFAIEKNRANLALKKDFSSLKATYISKFPEIPDRNTSRMWSVLNQIDITSNINPMAWKRVNICASLVKKNSKVLDIGFGSAKVEEIILKRNINVKLYGIDIAKKSVIIAKKKFINHNFRVGSILNLPYKGSSFDFVLALEILEHIQPHNTFKALSEVYRVLKPKGYFIISVPLNEGLEQLVNEDKNFNAHVRIYTPELIKTELQISGFIVLKEKYLFAFHHYYILKSLVAMLFLKKYKPNNIIILCQKI